MDRKTSKRTVDHRPLAGHRVALTGAFAALTRVQAVKMLVRHGGDYLPRVTRQTSMLVVGLSGFPLLKDGTMSRKLARAQALRDAGHTIEIVREDDWYERLEPEGQKQVCRFYRLDQIPGLTGVPARRVQSWIRAGLIRPAEQVNGDDVPRFDYRHIASLKRLDELSRAGVSAATLKQSLKQLSDWFPEAHDVLSRLDRLSAGRVVMRTDDDTLVDVAGQRVMDFEEREQVSAAFVPPAPVADELFEDALTLEDDDQLAEAEAVYRQWLARFGVDVDVCFNLANVLHRQGKDDAALERYRTTVELDPRYAAAWLNLSNLLSELEQHEEALAASRRTVELEPASSEALYNLASTLEELGRSAEARKHWESFLRLESTGEWADYARARLDCAS